MKHLLLEAREEITRLRRENEVLRAKVETMELFAQTLRTQPYYEPMGMAEDVVFKLSREVQKIEEEAKS